MARIFVEYQPAGRNDLKIGFDPKSWQGKDETTSMRTVEFGHIGNAQRTGVVVHPEVASSRVE